MTMQWFEILAISVVCLIAVIVGGFITLACCTRKKLEKAEKQEEDVMPDYPTEADPPASSAPQNTNSVSQQPNQPHTQGQSRGELSKSRSYHSSEPVSPHSVNPSINVTQQEQRGAGRPTTLRQEEVDAIYDEALTNAGVLKPPTVNHPRQRTSGPPADGRRSWLQPQTIPSPYTSYPADQGYPVRPHEGLQASYLYNPAGQSAVQSTPVIRNSRQIERDSVYYDQTSGSVYHISPGKAVEEAPRSPPVTYLPSPYPGSNGDGPQLRHPGADRSRAPLYRPHTMAYPSPVHTGYYTGSDTGYMYRPAEVYGRESIEPDYNKRPASLAMPHQSMPMSPSPLTPEKLKLHEMLSRHQGAGERPFSYTNHL